MERKRENTIFSTLPKNPDPREKEKPEVRMLKKNKFQ